MSKGAKWLLILPCAGLALLLGVWRWLIFSTERTTPFSGTPLPTCTVQLPESSYADAQAQAWQQVQALMAEQRIPGLSIAVAYDGRILWSEGFGFADQEKRIPACPDTQFRIGSISKALTAAAAALLYEQGKLDLNAPIQQYVPAFPEKGASITALELASHSSGITDSRDNPDAANATHYPSVSASLARFQDAPLLSPPGSRYDYSSYGYVLLSAVVEGASGEGFLSYMHRHIFEPLRMSHTMEDDVTKALPQRAHFYSYGRGGAVVDAPFDDLSKYWGAAGFLSTSEDLVRFGSTLLRGDFLNPPTRRVVFSPHSRVRPFVGYGLGWMLARDLHLREVYFHPGGIIGARSMLACYPREKMCFALLTNIGHTQLPFARLMGIVNPFLDAAP